jgi:hypothetical protein
MKRGIVSKANWKRDSRLKKLLNGLKKNILAMPCRVKPSTIIFFSHEREKRGRATGKNTGNAPYRQPSG